MKCLKCNQEYSDTVLPLHIAICKVEKEQPKEIKTADQPLFDAENNNQIKEQKSIRGKGGK